MLLGIVAILVLVVAVDLLFFSRIALVSSWTDVAAIASITIGLASIALWWPVFRKRP